MAKDDRMVFMHYGTGCSKYKNCFTCQVKPDCSCSTKKVVKPSILIDQEIIWSDRIKIKI